MCDNCGKCKAEQISKDKLPLIDSVFMILTERCNLACRYCFVNQNPREMTLDVALDTIDFLIKNSKLTGNTPMINFFGGEPLLKWKEIIVPVVEYIREEKNIPFNISMTSNGVLLDRGKLEYMKKHKIGLLFSIDGNKKTQDVNRPFHNGKGSFDVLKDKIPLVLEYYPDMTFRATIANDTVENTFDNMMFAIDQGYNNMFFIPNVFAEWTLTQKETLATQMRKFSDYFIQAFRDGGKIVKLPPLDEAILKITKINNAHKNNKFRERPNTIGKGKCGLGASRFASVGTDGSLYGCQEMVSDMSEDNIFTIGNIYSGVDNDKRYDLSTLFNETMVKGVNMNCESCKHNTICDGGCVANNFIANKDINLMPEMFCFWSKLLLDEAIYICNVMGEEKNLLFKDTYFNKRR